jgi:hypothetical protein
MRVWRICGDGLRGWSQPERWVDGWQEARCLRAYAPGHIEPCGHPVGLHCQHGFHARVGVPLSDVPLLRDTTYERVIGIAEGAGPSVVGPRGFRAQRARIVALSLPLEVVAPPMSLTPRPWQSMRRAIIGSYPSALVYPSLGDMLAAHPLSDTSGLLQAVPA